MSKSSKKVKQMVISTLLNHYNCDSVEIDSIGYGSWDCERKYKDCYTIWYSPCGAPDSEWVDYQVFHGARSIKASEVKNA